MNLFEKRPKKIYNIKGKLTDNFKGVKYTCGNAKNVEKNTI